MTAASVQVELVLGCLSCLRHFSSVFQGPQDSKGTDGSIGHIQPTVHLLRGDGNQFYHRIEVPTTLTAPTENSAMPPSDVFRYKVCCFGSLS